MSDPAGALIGYYERYDEAVDPQGPYKAGSPDGSRSEKG